MSVVGRVMRLGRKRDRRSLIATLTPAGRKLIDQAIEARFSEASSAVSGLGNSERKQLAELLRKLEAVLGAIPQQEGLGRHTHSQLPGTYRRQCPHDLGGTPKMIPFAVERIDHLVFRVQDLSRSIEFYRAVLGCDVVRQRDHLGLVHLRAGASMIDLISVDGTLGARGGAPAGTGARNVDHLCLRIEPFNEQSLVEHLDAFGLSPLGRAEVNFGAEGDGLSLYFPDPDGNVIELKGPADG